MAEKERRRKDYSAEPWGAQTLFVDKVLSTDDEDVYIAFWSPRQIRFLATMRSLIKACSRYVIPLPWLETLINEYMRLAKFEDGATIKHAKDVAKGGRTYMSFNVARWKRILYGEEVPEE
jgi:hypothetical protein